MTMSRLKYYRMEAGLSIAQLARLAQVDETTCKRAESGKPVQEVKAYAIAKAISQAYGQELSIEDLEIVIYS
jgi:DNA-binding XRE family transcriptional regulator